MSHTYEQTTSALGDMTIAFQSLEQSFVEILIALIRADTATVGYIVCSQLPFKKICLVVESLCIHRCKDAELLGELATLITQANKLEEDRNRYTHSYYDIREYFIDHVRFERIKRTLKFGKGIKNQNEEHDTKKVGILAFELRQLSIKVDEFLARLINSGVAKDYSWSDDSTE